MYIWSATSGRTSFMDTWNACFCHSLELNGSIRHFVALSYTLWHSVAFYGIGWHSVAQSGILWHRVACCGTEWHAPGRAAAGWIEAGAGCSSGQTHRPATVEKSCLQLSTWIPLSGFPKLLQIEGSQKPLWQKERTGGCIRFSGLTLKCL